MTIGPRNDWAENHTFKIPIDGPISAKESLSSGVNDLPFHPGAQVKDPIETLTEMERAFQLLALKREQRQQQQQLSSAGIALEEYGTMTEQTRTIVLNNA